MKLESLDPPTLRFGAVLGFGWNLFRHLFWPVAILSALLLPLEFAVTALETAIQVKGGVWAHLVGSVFLGIVTSSLSSAIFLSLGVAAWKGEGFELLSVRRGFGLWPRVFCAQFLCLLLFLCGFALLIIPGFYVLLRLVVTDLVVVVDRVSAPTAMKKSLFLTKGREGDLLVVLGTLIALSIGFGVLLYLLGAALPALNSLPILTLGSYLGLLVGGFSHFIAIGIYLALVRESDASVESSESG